MTPSPMCSLSAGGGGRIPQIMGHVERLTGQLQPRVLVVNVGTNNLNDKQGAEFQLMK